MAQRHWSHTSPEQPEEQDTDPGQQGRGSYHSPLWLRDFGHLLQSHTSPEQPEEQDTDPGQQGHDSYIYIYISHYKNEIHLKALI